MRLYSGMSPEFVRDTVRNQIASKLETAFFNYYRYKPSPAETNSWKNSLRAMAQIVEYAKLDDHGVLLEYQLPLSSQRLDCMLCGKDGLAKDRAVIVELKQWEECETTRADKLVLSWVGGRKREILHPSVQVGQYQRYLQDSHSAFHETAMPVGLDACAYLHNYVLQKDDPILDTKFSEHLSVFPIFSRDGADELAQFLASRLETGGGFSVLGRIEQSRYKTSKKLMEHIVSTVESRSPWVLLDEQLVVFEKILSAARSFSHDSRKQVIIVHGGPGTGKSVVAINLMAEILRENRVCHYATGSKAFTETLWSLLGSRSKSIVRYFNSYGAADPDSIDVLVCDESHRIRETSNSRFTPRAKKSSVPQVEEILNAAKVSVFFIDDRQMVRPNEIGSTEYIARIAGKYGAEISDYDLTVQFRCAGSQGFVNWINNTLGIERNANVLWDGAEGFEFRVFESPFELEEAIRRRAAEGHSARVAAGFCWPWSKPRFDGSLVDDVEIGDYRRPWNAKPDSGKLSSEIPQASLWVTDPRGIDQIGCVYTIQGFELDYVGVIWGKDLSYDLDLQTWVADKTESCDKEVKRSKDNFLDLVKNTYRVLLSRGMKGCYVYFIDKETERFVRTRLDSSAMETALDSALPTPEERYTTHVPLLTLDVAAGSFGVEQIVNDEEFNWIRVNSTHLLRKGMFVARVIGHSMEPRIEDGAYCLFSSPVVGTRQGKIVLVRLRNGVDPESGERFTLKSYSSEKVFSSDGTWKHSKIFLRPFNHEYATIELSEEEDGSFDVVAEFVEVVG